MGIEDVHESWERVRDRIATLPNGKGREEAWLALKLKFKIARIHNWVSRGIPPSAASEVAAAIGWSPGQVLGAEDRPSDWPFETVSPQRLAALTPRQMAMIELVVVRELERIESATTKRDGTSG
jgi:hypothetical protein